MQNWAKLVPELVVRDLPESLGFWVGLIGFSIAYERREEGFAYLDLDGAQIMLEERDEAARQWIAAALEPPFGRGMNLQVEVPSVDAILARLKAAGVALFLPAEEKWYRAGDIEHGQRQFLVQDPDGYLLRPVEILGERPFQGSPPT